MILPILKFWQPGELNWIDLREVMKKKNQSNGTEGLRRTERIRDFV